MSMYPCDVSTVDRDAGDKQTHDDNLKDQEHDLIGKPDFHGLPSLSKVEDSVREIVGEAEFVFAVSSSYNSRRPTVGFSDYGSGPRNA